MLPFSKRKNQSEEVELGEEDFELVELAAPVRVNPRDADLARTVSRASRPRTIIPVSRRILDEDVEEDVAGQCLASIAAETSRDGTDPYSSSHIRAALQRPLGVAAPVDPVAPAAVAATSTSAMSRLPAVSAPPFLRTTTIPFRGYNDAPGVRDSSPPPAFVRRSSPVIPVIPAAAPSSYVAVAAAAAASGAEGNAASVAPVAMPMTQRPNEPTVIVIRERPRAAWIFAAAAIGALGSFGATRLVSVPPDVGPPAPPAAAAAPLVAPPSTVVVAPAAPLAPSAPLVLAAAPVVSAPAVAAAGPGTSAAPASAASGAAIVHFGDDQGVAIKSPALRRPAASPSGPAAPPAAPATARSTGPRAPSMGPALPDGSFGLGRLDTATTASVAPPAPPLTASAFSPAAEPPRKHALTPEQQLAAAQLKASMK